MSETAMAPEKSQAGPHDLTVAEVERLFVDEAALLDAWDFDAWLDMLTDDVRYMVPATTSPDADHRNSVFFISDDSRTLRSRANQLQRMSAWSENPRSRTRRLVTNFRILEASETEATVTANFAVWRFQYEVTDVFVGRYDYVLARTPAGLKIKTRRATLDMDTLRPHGKLSFIL